MQKNNWIKKIFTPAILFLNRLNYIWKFLFISFFFVLPLIVATYFLISSLNHDIKFAEKERLGVQYILPVRKFLQNVQQHRGMMSGYLNGDQNFIALITDKQKEILTNENEIDALDETLGRSLETTDRWSDIKSQWQKVRLESIQGSPSQSFKMHSDLAQQIIIFIAHIGDTSNLILDPDLDTYYLMDAFVNNIPFISERLGQLRAFVLSLVPEKEISVADKRFVENLLTLARTSFQKMNNGMEVAYRFNPSIKAPISLSMGKAVQSVDTFFSFIDTNIINSDINRINPIDYYNEATQTINETFNLYDRMSPILDELLKKRIDSLVFQKNIVLSVIVAMLTLVIYLFAGFYFSIKKTISELGEISDRLIRGEAGEKIKISTKDELGKIGDLFASVGDALVSSNKVLEADMAKRKEAEEKLNMRTKEMERISDFMVGREMKMVELKNEIKELRAKVATKE